MPTNSRSSGPPLRPPRAPPSPPPSRRATPVPPIKTGRCARTPSKNDQQPAELLIVLPVRTPPRKWAPHHLVRTGTDVTVKKAREPEMVDPRRAPSRAVSHVGAHMKIERRLMTSGGVSSCNSTTTCRAKRRSTRKSASWRIVRQRLLAISSNKFCRNKSRNESRMRCPASEKK